MRLLSYLFFILIFSACQQGTIYYVNSDQGNDDNSGISPDDAWASLEKVNSMIFKPGDHILLKAGSKYYGQLEPQGSGEAEKPITLSKYGEGPNPAIHGKGEALHTLLLFNVENWIVKNLEVTNHGDARAAGRRGIVVRAHNFGDCHNIILDSLEIHHVNGSLVKKQGGGSAILWQNDGDSIPTRFVNLIIQNCYLHHCERNGINSKGNANRDKWHPSMGVVIRHNLLEQIPGDGIVPIGCDGALVEYNVMRDCPDILSHKEAAAGIWPWSSDNTLIQYNEVSGHKAKWDGQGFDSDYNCTGTIIQYNYSHDNFGGFLLICNDGSSLGKSWNKGTKGTIIKNNLSINDGIRPYPTERRGWFSPVMHITGPVSNTHIENNVIIMPQKLHKNIDNTTLKMNNWGNKWPQNTTLSNNIFYAYQSAEFDWGKARGNIFENNLIGGDINGTIDSSKNSFNEADFININARGEGLSLIKNFILNPDSPDKGKGIQNNNSPLFK